MVVKKKIWFCNHHQMDHFKCDYNEWLITLTDFHFTTEFSNNPSINEKRPS